MTLSIIMASRVFVNSEAFSSPCDPTAQGLVVETEAQEDRNDNLEEDVTCDNEDYEEDEVQTVPSSSTSPFLVHSSQQGGGSSSIPPSSSTSHSCSHSHSQAQRKKVKHLPHHHKLISQ